MDNSGENSDGSSDENAMVIDEHYEEKDEKQNNKSDVHNKKDLISDNVEGLGEAVSPRQLKDNNVEENANAAELSEADADKEMEAEEEDDENEADDESDDTDDENEAESEGDDIAAGEGESDGGESESEDEESGEEGSDGDDNGGEEGSGEEEEVAEGDWETDDEVADSQPAAVGVESDSGDEVERCPICLNKFRGQDIGSPESCDHNFCLDCIMEWATNVNTCPVDRQVFRLVLAKHGDCESVYKRFPIEDKNVQESEEDGEMTYCEVCHRCDREDRLLLCDGCDNGYHCECLDPPLDSVPIEEWFCPECAPHHRPAPPQEEEVTGVSGTDGEEPALMAPPTRSSPRRRRIPRTQASERVRGRIAATRSAIAQMFESEELTPFSSSSISPRKPAKPRRKTKKRRKVTKKRKATTKKKGTKRKTKTKGKRRKTTRKKKKKASPKPSAYSPRGAAVAPAVTPKARLAGRLGLSKPPTGRTIPLQKLPLEKSMEGRRAAVGITSLSILGCRDELINFHDGDENVDPQPSTSGLVVRKASEAAARYSHSALKSHRPVQRPPLFARSNEKAPVAVPAPVSTGPVDVLGSIMQQQTVLSLMGQDVTINRDGSLTAKKEVLEKAKARSSADEQASRSRDSPIGDGKGKTKRVSETNPKGSEMYSDDDGGRSPYTDSEDDTREPSLTAETEGSKDLKTKTPDRLPSPPSNQLPSPPATRLPSPPRDWNKSPPRSWQAGKSSPQREGQEDFTTGGEACSSQASPVPSSQHTSPHPSSHQPSPVIDEIEPFPLCKDGYMENMDDSMSPKASGVKDSDNGQLPSGLLYDPVVDTPAQKEVDASGDNKTSPVVPVDDDLVIIPPPQEPYTRRLSVDSEDSSKEDRARLPISELPRIPKKKRRSNPIEVITIDDDDDDVEDSSRGVLQRLEHSNRKTHSSRRESKSRRDESRRSESDRHDRRSGRSNRRRNTPDNERLDSWADKRRVVLNDRGGLIVRTEDSYGDGSRSHRKHSRERSRSRDRGTDRSHERRKESRDRAYSKQESHRSRSRDRRKRRHETKDRSGSGSRSDHDRHERLDHDRYERSYHRKKKKRDRSAEGVKSDKRYVHIATEDDDFEQRSRRSRSDPRLASIEVPSKDKVDPREKARDKSSKERSDLKDAKSETWKDKHDKSVKDIKVDLRDKIDSRNKSDLRDRLDNRLQGDLREKLETKFRDKIEVKRKPESKDTRHVEEWGDHGSEKVSEDIPAGSKRSSDKVTDSVEVKRQKEDKAAVPSPDMFDDIWPSPEDQNKSNDKPQLGPGTKFKVNSSFSSVQQEKETPVKLPNTSKSDSSHPKGTDTNNVISSSVFPNEPPSHNNKPLLPTPLSFRKTNKTPPSSGDVLPQVDSMYDPSMPTETASPVTQENKEMSEQQPDISTINLQQPPPDFLLGNRLQSPTGTGLLGEGGFLIPGDPGVILQPPQNLVPISLGMLPPGFAPALPHSMPPRPGLMVNPLILNRPPPFTQMPPPGMPRFGWPGVDTQGVLQVPNQFEASSMSRFPGPFPTGPPPPIHTRPSLVNGGFEGLQSQAAAMGPRLFPPVMSVPGDPRQAIAQQGVPVSKPADTPSKSPSEQAQTTQTQPIKDSSNHLNPFNQISKLLNLRAQLVGLTKGSNANTSSSNVSGKGKVPGSGKGVFKIPLPPVTGSGEKPEKTSPTGAPSAETTEVVDMDMSPLDDDDNILVSPEYDKELKAEKEVSSVVFLNKADDLPSSAVELTNKQKAGKYMKKLHLQERVVEEVKLAIKPFYASKRIDKEEYKDILRKSVPKICHSKSGDINPAKIKSLIEAYVEKCQRAKSKVSKSNGERTKAKVAR